MKTKRSKSVPANEVEGSDDLLISVLIRLPPKSVFRFICVSKRWKNIINDHVFLEACNTKRRRSSDGYQPLFIKTFWPNSILRILDDPGVYEYGFANFPGSLGNLICSSNGLILCERKNIYSILNPITGVFVSMPPPPSIPKPEYLCIAYRALSVGLFSDEENTHELVVNYRVVRASIVPAHPEERKLEIETYSSHTGYWTESSIPCKEKGEVIDSLSPFVSKGVFHLLLLEGLILLYDSNYGGKKQLQSIQLPNNVGDECFSTCVSRSTIDDVLLSIIETDECIQVWKLPKNADSSYWRSNTITASEWTLLHNLNTISLHDKLPKNIPQNRDYHFDLVAWLPCNYILAVLRLKSHTFIYNFDTNEVAHAFRIVDYRPDCWFPYAESFSLSSYALRECRHETIYFLIARKEGDLKKGTMKWFNHTKGYGFISPEDGRDDLFVHRSSIKPYIYPGGLKYDGLNVEYTVDNGKDGCARAANVRIGC